MAIVQETFFIPDDIATGLATGIYRRVGGVIRYASGSKKGQIVKHLESIDLKAVEQAKGIGVKALQFMEQHKKEVGIGAVCVAGVGLGILIYSKCKNIEPKVLKEFRISLKVYVDAIRNGCMDVNIINSLITALENLRKHKDYNKLIIQLSADDLEVLIGRIYDYTIKLAQDNDFNLTDNELNTNNGIIVNLQSYLCAQKQIFEATA